MENSIAYALWDWVCRNVSYRSDDGEWWEFPDETIRDRASDCDGSANLLTSLLRSAGFNAYTVVGSYRGFGHAWTELAGEILETTYNCAHAVLDPHNYRAYAMFNDQEIIELWPWSMSQLFQLAHSESNKLALMAETVNGR